MPLIMKENLINYIFIPTENSLKSAIAYLILKKNGLCIIL